MKKSNLIVFVIVIHSLTIFTQSNNVTFENSQKKYKARSFKMAIDYYYRKKENKIKLLRIFYQKRGKKVNDEVLHPIYFHRKSKKEKIDYLSFSGDTIFYYNELKNGEISNKEVFCVLNKWWREKERIELNQLNAHSIEFLELYYYAPIKDTVYTYKMEIEYPPLQEVDTLSNGTIVTADSFYFIGGYHIKELGISKKHGFVWMKYTNENKYYEVYYY